MIYITGDTHIPVDVHKLSSKKFPAQRNLTKSDFVIICGDFGAVWDNSGEDIYWRKWLDNKPFTTLFVDGNHENFQLLNEFPIAEKYGSKVHQIGDSIFHLMRGEIYDIDGHSFFCMGGASSHDKELRVPYKSWWPEEIPSKQEMDHAVEMLTKHDWRVDYIITHCAPSKIMNEISSWYEDDPITRFLQFIDDNCRYKNWFFGHYHVDEVVDSYHIAVYNDIIRLPTVSEEEWARKRGM